MHALTEVRFLHHRSRKNGPKMKHSTMTTQKNWKTRSESIELVASVAANETATESSAPASSSPPNASQRTSWLEEKNRFWALR